MSIVVCEKQDATSVAPVMTGEMRRLVPATPLDPAVAVVGEVRSFHNTVAQS
jgi:hypothetical protein